jgi:outer membrane protein assembly factor BamB
VYIYPSIEGEPYDRGYQYGYLASAEIVDMINRWSKWIANVKIKLGWRFDWQPFPGDAEKWWEISKDKALRKFEKYYPEEYMEEMRGIAEGVKARGGTVFGHTVNYEDILTLNEMQDCWYTKQYPLRKLLPIGIIGGIRNILMGGKIKTEGSCSAFVATGDATTDGRVIIAHTTQPMYYITERVNIILDVKPTEGNRFTMICPPGQIWSNEDWYQNEKGIVLTETTIASQGPYTEKGIPIAVRTRKAIQYSDSIDDVLNFLLKGNNGLFPCEWLMADTKTGEIASIELALLNTPIKRTFNGFYWSCNAVHDSRVMRETYGIPVFMSKILNKRFPDIFISDRAQKFMEIKNEYYGKIDRELAKKIISTNPICTNSNDAKITDSELMKDLGTLTFWGNPNGSLYTPNDEIKTRWDEITDLPPTGWFEFYPSESTFISLSPMQRSSEGMNEAIVKWKYDTNDLRNTVFSSCSIYENVLYAATSSGTVYGIDVDTGVQKWMRIVGEKTVKPEVSNDLVIIGTNKGLHILDKNTGKIKWERLIGEIISKPIIEDKSLIVSCSDGAIYSFDITSGNKIWDYNFEKQVYTSEIKNNIMYVCSEETCYAFDIYNKNIIWNYKTDGMISASPRVEDKTVYFGSWDGCLHAVDHATGILKWKFETGWGIDSTPEIAGGLVFVGSLDNKFYCLDEKNGEIKWGFQCRSAIHSSPVIYGEYVFFGCDDGKLYVLDKKTGELGWSFTPGYSIKDDDANNYMTTMISSDPVAYNGFVYFGAKGSIYSLEAQTFEFSNEKKTEEDDYNIYLLFGLIIMFIVGVIIFYKQKLMKMIR